MGLHQHWVALLVPDDSLIRITQAKKYVDEPFESFFIRDKYSHLAICLHLIEPHCYHLRDLEDPSGSALVQNATQV